MTSDIAFRAFQMYKEGKISEEQAREIFKGRYEKAKRMKSNSALVEESSDPDPDNDDLFISG